MIPVYIVHFINGKKRRRSKNSTSGLTPPNKTSSNMATTNQNNISQVLTQAHGTLHGPLPDTPISTPISTQVTNNQTFTCSPNNVQMSQNQMPPVLQSTPYRGLVHLKLFTNSYHLYHLCKPQYLLIHQ